MPVHLPDDFPLLRASARRPDRFDAAVEAFRQGQQGGAIRKKIYDDAKSQLAQVVEEAWRQHVGAPFFHAGLWEAQPKAVQDLHHDIMIMSLHDLLSTRKKIDRSTATGPAVDVMNAIMAEAYPLAELSRDLKHLVVKGREPRAEPVQVNPDKEIGACSCCFRGIAVTGGGHMAHHGYQRPGDGHQTSSCAGIRFPPLEVSTEGLEWLIWHTGEALDTKRQQIDKAPEATVVRWTERPPLRERRTRHDFVTRQAQLGEPDFPRRHAAWVEGLKRGAKAMEGDLKLFEGELEKWSKPESALAEPVHSDGDQTYEP